MKILQQSADTYTNFVMSKIPKRFRKSNVFLFALMAVALPTTIYLGQQIVDVRQRAAEIDTTPVTPPNPIFEYAAQFDGSTGRIEINPTDNLNFSTPLTIELWANALKPTTSYDAQTVIGSIVNTSNSSCNNSFKIYTLVNNALPDSYIYVANFFINGQQYTLSQNTASNEGTQYGKWSHVAVTIDTTNTSQLFVNGMLKKSLVLPGQLCNPEKGVVYGADTDGNINFVRSSFTGLIDNVRISNAVRYPTAFVPPTSFPTIDPQTLVLNEFDYGMLQNGKTVGGVKFVESKVVYISPSPAPTVVVDPSIPPISKTPTPTVRFPSPTVSGVAVPTNLRVASNSAGIIQIQWDDNATNETLYRVYYRRTDLSPIPGYSTLNLPINATSWTHQNVVSGAKYQYIVRAFKNTLASPASSTLSVIAYAPTPATPTNLHTGAITSTSIPVLWDDVATNDSEYQVRYKRTDIPNQTTTTIKLPANSSSWTLDNLTDPGAQYTISLRACVYTVCSPWSSSLNPKVLATPPTAPSALKAPSVTSNSITLTWVDNATTETRYLVSYRNLTTNITTSTYLSENSTTFTLSNLSANTQYGVSVYACLRTVCSTPASLKPRTLQ